MGGNDLSKQIVAQVLLRVVQQIKSGASVARCVHSGQCHLGGEQRLHPLEVICTELRFRSLRGQPPIQQ
jgi:hypothetical protein